VIANLSAMPDIALKGNAVGTGYGAWSKMVGYFTYRREEFLAHYHKRSNVETTFSMIKRKFGDSLRSKTETAQSTRRWRRCSVITSWSSSTKPASLGSPPIFGQERVMPKNPRLTGSNGQSPGLLTSGT
jgi:hypothetical protein